MLSLTIPQKINLKIFENYILVEGPLGAIKKRKSKEILLHFDSVSNKLWFLNSGVKEKHFFLSILNRIIWGVLKGFHLKLNIIGVGYKAFLENNCLVLKLGFSHNVLYPIPKDIKIKILTQKVLTLVILGTNFQKVSSVAAEIRALKPVEPYKGKGIRYYKEIVKKKEGKKTNV
jgi:large subunit ribosomal protein L6